MAPTNEAPQPFRNRAENYAYIPRYDGDAPMPHHVPRPAASAQPQVVYYQPWQMYQAYPMPQHPVYQAPAIAAAPRPQYYYQYPPYYYHPYPTYHQPAPAQPAQPQIGARLPDGRLPWYGRTAQEVAEDAAKVASRKETVNRNEFEPTAAPDELYWVRLLDKEYKKIPLGTIKNTWNGTWKLDAHGQMYFTATELK